MSNKRIVRRGYSQSERWRVELLADYGFFGKTIAKRIFGSDSDADVRRVYRICKEARIKLNDWRRGDNNASRKVLNQACRVSTSSTPKLRVVA